MKSKMSKTQKNTHALIDYEEAQPCYRWCNPFSWYPFYPLSSTMLFYSFQLNCMCQTIVHSSNTNRSIEPTIVTSMQYFQSVNSRAISHIYSFAGYSINSGLNQYPCIYPRYPYCGYVVTVNGTISVQLQHYIRVDITVDKAIRLVNFPGKCVAAMNYFDSCIIHPISKILQEQTTVNMEIGNRLAKFSNRGITFTSLGHSLVYLVDTSGTKSTFEYFRNLNYDFSLDVFYTKSIHGEAVMNDCFLKIANSVHRCNRNGDQMWIIAGICIQQNLLGDVCITHDFGRRIMRTSPTFGTISVSTPYIYMAAGCDPEKYVFVQRGQQRLSSNLRSFTVRNGTQKAGFDSRGRLVLS
ncbi:uncharacterized protein LOC111614768 [Centruroides sculpturatus]|uniref:uncharacterized protein LOC111614768 n=1 Tax=Centruroides sculpturatus TaxID=218467 RepID=UPI000C6E8AA2|nr:uncharacterized protein LOC111614768 [Centruroides sculpturatus]XP_023211910.1 uncharacterized protein LOC111614768 [Centruroides sculpturatus]